jgi:hypothetical protein
VLGLFLFKIVIEKKDIWREGGKGREKEGEGKERHVQKLYPPFYKILALFIFSLFLNFPICKKLHNHPSNKKCHKQKKTFSL